MRSKKIVEFRGGISYCVKMKKGTDDFRTFRNSFRHIYAANNWKSQWELFSLNDRWHEIVGGEIATVTRPAFFRKNVLYIYVENSSWMQQVHFLRLELQAKINKELEDKQIDDIRWLLKPREPEERKANTTPPVVRSVDQVSCQHMKQLMEYIQDEECMKALYKLWHSSKTKSRD